jgi:hypothetical protein
MAIPSEEGKLQHFLSKEMQQHGSKRDRHVLPWDPGKQEVMINGLFGLQPHAETYVSQCKFCVISRSRKGAKSMQLATVLIICWIRCQLGDEVVSALDTMSNQTLG